MQAPPAAKGSSVTPKAHAFELGLSLGSASVAQAGISFRQWWATAEAAARFSLPLQLALAADGRLDAIGFGSQGGNSLRVWLARLALESTLGESFRVTPGFGLRVIGSFAGSVGLGPEYLVAPSPTLGLSYRFSGGDTVGLDTEFAPLFAQNAAGGFKNWYWRLEAGYTLKGSSWKWLARLEKLTSELNGDAFSHSRVAAGFRYGW